MAKSYTSLEQSRKLAKILPLDSADMCWIKNKFKNEFSANLFSVVEMRAYYDSSIYDWDRFYELTPCWSLAALLDVLNETAYFIDEDASINLSSYKTIKWDLGIDNSDLGFTAEANPVDACYEMILKLK